MADLGVHLTDKRMVSLTKRLNEVYNEAYIEAVRNNLSAVEKLANINVEGLPDDIKQAKIKSYTMQIMRTENIVDDMSKRINNAGTMASDIIRGEMSGIYALNRDYSNYSILQQAEIDYSFSQYDMNQIAVLVQEGESPFTKIAYKKMGQDPDITRRLQNELMKATINGESQSQIMKRIKGITGQTSAQARRVAQTERTRVQTQGRMMSIREAEAIGINVDKQWVARMVRTRESHMDVHLQIVRSDEAFNNGLEFPGDPKGSAAEVINCHCYVKPMVKSVSPALAKHRAEFQKLDFERYQESFHSNIINAQNDLKYYDDRVNKINGYLVKAKERGDEKTVKYHENALKVAKAKKSTAQTNLRNAERNQEASLIKTQKVFTNPGNSDIININLKAIQHGDKDSMDRVKFDKIVKGLEKNGVKIIADTEGDAYLNHMGAEAMTLSDGSAIIFRSGQTPTSSAVFEEIIHINQIKREGPINTYGTVSAEIEYLRREIEANEKLLKYKSAYGLTANDINDINRNLNKYYARKGELNV